MNVKNEDMVAAVEVADALLVDEKTVALESEETVFTQVEEGAPVTATTEQ